MPRGTVADVCVCLDVRVRVCVYIYIYLYIYIYIYVSATVPRGTQWSGHRVFTVLVPWFSARKELFLRAGDPLVL